MSITKSVPFIIAEDAEGHGAQVRVVEQGGVEIMHYQSGGFTPWEREQAVWLANAILRLVAEYDAEHARWERMP